MEISPPPFRMGGSVPPSSIVGPLEQWPGRNSSNFAVPANRQVVAGVRLRDKLPPMHEQEIAFMYRAPNIQNKRAEKILVNLPYLNFVLASRSTWTAKEPITVDEVVQNWAPYGIVLAADPDQNAQPHASGPLKSKMPVNCVMTGEVSTFNIWQEAKPLDYLYIIVKRYKIAGELFNDRTENIAFNTQLGESLDKYVDVSRSESIIQAMPYSTPNMISVKALEYEDEDGRKRLGHAFLIGRKNRGDPLRRQPSYPNEVRDLTRMHQLAQMEIIAKCV